MFGMTCDGADIICNNFHMVKDLEIGDWLCLSGMGAYTYTARSTFNGMTAAKNTYVIDMDVSKNVLMIEDQEELKEKEEANQSKNSI